MPDGVENTHGTPTGGGRGGGGGRILYTLPSVCIHLVSDTAVLQNGCHNYNDRFPYEMGKRVTHNSQRLQVVLDQGLLHVVLEALVLGCVVVIGPLHAWAKEMFGRIIMANLQEPKDVPH